MRSTFFYVVIAIFTLCIPAHAQNHGNHENHANHARAAEHCIDAHSGAESVECLEKLLDKTRGILGRLEHKIILKLAQKTKHENFPEMHAKLAIAALRDSSREFEKFAQRQCDFAIGYSGAAASGSGQVYGSCQIQLHDWRIQYLQTVLTQPRYWAASHRLLPVFPYLSHPARLDRRGCL